MQFIRKAVTEDLPVILDIYRHARQFMAENGNPGQWGAHYPPDSLVKNDIEQKQLYVLAEDSQIHGVFLFAPGPDPTYQIIEQGSWLSDAPYGVIHRVASDGTVHGFLRLAVRYCEQQTPHLRIDTHRDNLIMQRAIEKNGFSRRGIIFTDDGSPRIAYEKV